MAAWRPFVSRANSIRLVHPLRPGMQVEVGASRPAQKLTFLLFSLPGTTFGSNGTPEGKFLALSLQHEIFDADVEHLAGLQCLGE